MSEIPQRDYFDDEHEPALRESTIALDQWPIDMIRQPSLELADIFAIQGLVMGYLRRRARHSRHDRDQNVHMFALLDRDYEASYEESVYDGTQDNYMVCRVQKLYYDQRRMTVSFLSTTNTEQTKNINTRELYRFDWLDNGNRQAWYSSTTRSRLDEGLHIQVNEMRPVTSVDALDLQNRMLDLSQAVNPISTDSILIPAAPPKVKFPWLVEQREYYYGKSED